MLHYFSFYFQNKRLNFFKMKDWIFFIWSNTIDKSRPAHAFSRKYIISGFFALLLNEMLGCRLLSSQFLLKRPPKWNYFLHRYFFLWFQLYEEIAFLRNPTLSHFLSHILEALEDISVPVDPAMKKTLEQHNLIWTKSEKKRTCLNFNYSAEATKKSSYKDNAGKLSR